VILSAASAPLTSGHESDRPIIWRNVRADKGRVAVLASDQGAADLFVLLTTLVGFCSRILGR